MDSNQCYNPYKWVICPPTRVINLHITSYLPYPEPLSRNRSHQVPDAAGDTPIALAVRKKNRYSGQIMATSDDRTPPPKR